MTSPAAMALESAEPPAGQSARLVVAPAQTLLHRQQVSVLSWNQLHGR